MQETGFGSISGRNLEVPPQWEIVAPPGNTSEDMRHWCALSYTSGIGICTTPNSIAERATAAPGPATAATLDIALPPLNNQTFGLSSHSGYHPISCCRNSGKSHQRLKEDKWGQCGYHAKPPYLPLRPDGRLCDGVKWAEFLSWHWGEQSDASRGYLENRTNGDDQDIPHDCTGIPIPFPHDGTYKWATPGRLCAIRYDEGIEDKLWMEAKDRNYLNRIEQERHQHESTAAPSVSISTNPYTFLSSTRQRSISGEAAARPTETHQPHPAKRSCCDHCNIM